MDDRRTAVKDTYDRIATHFASTREYAWPEVEAFVDDAPRARVALDVGCGNCRHAELLADRADRVLGIDVSRGLLETGRDRAHDRGFTVELIQGDAGVLPVRTNAVDLAVYVATLHHLPTREARVASLDELARVLTDEGRALVSAWSTAHDRFADERERDDHETEGFDTTIEWTLPGGDPVDRFYHIYAPSEFEADVTRSGLTLERMEISSGNCYAVVVTDEKATEK